MDSLKLLKRVVFGLILFSLLPLTTVFYAGENSSLPGIPKRYLLPDVDENDIDTASNVNFNYYPLDCDNWAVGLKETKKKTFTGTINITPTMDGHTITAIWRNGFQECPATEIDITADLEIIDYEAFIGSSIKDIIIPYTITGIGDAAFYACKNLESAIIQNNPGSGGSSACACQSHDSSRRDAMNPKRGVVDSSEIPAESVDACAIAAEEKEEKTQCTLTTIPTLCFFNCTKLEAIGLPRTITDIEYEAFRGCSALASTLYFKSIRNIRSRAFEGCSSLNYVYISKTLFEKVDGLYGTIEPHAFNYCKSDLKLYFCTTDTKIEKWLTETDSAHSESNWNSNWGWRVDIGDPATAGNHYSYSVLSAEVEYSDDWTYVVDGAGNATLMEYVGDLPEDDPEKPSLKHFITINDEIDGYTIRRIDAGVFDKKAGIKEKIERIYLPTTLWVIERQMFTVAYSKLNVISDNTDCIFDYNDILDGTTPQPRIDLSMLDELEFIGYRSFAEIKESQRNLFEMVHLPAHLLAVGDEAFSINDKNLKKFHYKNVTDFRWDYDENSQLRCIGNDAFYKFGVNDEEQVPKRVYPAYRTHQLTTLVFPKTFRYFGMLKCDSNYLAANSKSGYEFFEGDATEKSNRPGHTFTGCPLIGTVIFKGSETSSEGSLESSENDMSIAAESSGSGGGGASVVDETTTDLIIPALTFYHNESLQTFIIEERYGHHVTLHTQNAAFGEQIIGGGGDVQDGTRTKHDFRGDPFLQTLVLPTQHTTLHIQHLALQGNSRAAMYLSGTLNGGNVKGHIKNSNKNNGDGQWTRMVPDYSGPTTSYTNGGLFNYTDVISRGDVLANVKNWRTLADESTFDAGNAANGGTDNFSHSVGLYYNETDCKNSFGLSQQIPVYENIHYKDNINGVDVEVGDASNANELYIDNTNTFRKNGDVDEIDHQRSKCAFVCHYAANASDQYAIMTKYLFNMRDKRTTTNAVRAYKDKAAESNAILTTATIPSTVTAKHRGLDFTPTVKIIGASAFSAAWCDGNDGTSVSETNELRKVVLPNTITAIKEYAFLRAYGIKNICTSAGDYKMPSTLLDIGKNAFSFCGVEKVLDIPDSCLFYENTGKISKNDVFDYNNPRGSVPTGASANAQTGVEADPIFPTDGKTTSVFSNSVDLRQITFAAKDGSDEDATSSTYYSTTTYDSKTKVTAIYSEGTSYNANRLLIVLNRDTGDRHDESGDATLVSSKIKFNGNYKQVSSTTKPFLFGAYKMGLWIDILDVGPATLTKKDDGTDASTRVIQPIFSAVGTRNSEGTLTKDAIYLGVEVKKYDRDALKCDLKEIEGEIFVLPAYAFNACEALDTVKLPYRNNGQLPEGLFINCNNPDLKYEVWNGSTRLSTGKMTDPSDGSTINVLDLSASGYKSIGKNTFKGNSQIQGFIAPASLTSIGEGAFENCTNLKYIDLRRVTGTLQLSNTCFKNTGITSMSVTSGEIAGIASAWPQTGTVRLDKDGTFQGCTSLTSVELPASLDAGGAKVIGKNAFQGCTNLATVTFSGDNNNIAQIGTSAFSGCPLLQLSNFDFTHMKALTTIGGSAFKSSGGSASADTYGVVSFPENITTFNESCFESANLKVVTYECDTTINLGKNSFKGCTNLKAVRFKKHDCGWTANTTGIFNNCTNLEELQLPNTFTLKYTTGSIIDGDNSIIIYSFMYKKDLVDAMTTQWRKRTGATKDAQVFFLVDSVSKMAEHGLVSGTNTVVNTTDGFWAVSDGKAIPLGGITAYDSSLSKVTFEGGATLINAVATYGTAYIPWWA